MQPPSRPGINRPVALAATAMIVYLVLALHGAWNNSATADELVHLTSGWTGLHWNDHRLNPEHPPLVKLLAALPVTSWLPDDPRTPVNRMGSLSNAWSRVQSLWDAAGSRPAAQWRFAHEVSFAMTDSWLAELGVNSPERVPTHLISPPKAWAWSLRPQLFLARAVLVVFPLLLAVALFATGRSLASAGVASLAVVLLAFDPTFIGHGTLVTNDVAAASTIFLSIAALRWWMRAGTSVSGFVLALTTGLAAVAKFSTVILGPLFLILLAGVVARKRNRRVVLRALAAIVFAAAGTWIVVWAAYGFRWSAISNGAPLDFDAAIRTRAAVVALHREGIQATPQRIEERLRTDVDDLATGRLLRAIHNSRILPEAYVHGIAVVRASAAPRTGYLHGEYSDHGFPLYFLWTFLYKTPLVVILGALLVPIAALRRRLTTDQMWWLGAPVIVLFAFASMSGVNIGHRHLLVIYPFLWLLVATTWMNLVTGSHKRDVLPGVLIALAALPAFFAVSLNGIHPILGNHIAFMNAFAGGPVHGADKLTDSNVDWGQDAYRLADWWNRQDPRPLMAYAATGATDPRAIQLPVLNTRLGYPFAPMTPIAEIPPGALLVVSQTSKSGVLDDAATRARFRELLAHYELVDRVGFGMEVYAPVRARQD